MTEKLSRREFIKRIAALGAVALAEGCGLKATPTLQKPPDTPTPPATNTPLAAGETPEKAVQSFISIPTEMPQSSATPTPAPTSWDTFLEKSQKMEVPVIDPAEKPNKQKLIIPEVTPTAVVKPTETAEQLKRHFIYRGDSSKPRIALTFDDGYFKEEIQRFIDVVTLPEIRALNPKFTLFLVGQAIDDFPSLVKKIYGLGCCQIECHSYTHPPGFATLPVDKIIEEIDRSQKSKDNAVGKKEDFRLFRPPGGVISGNILKAIEARNLKGIVWSYSVESTSPLATPDYIRNRILSLAKTGSKSYGSICLAHLMKSDVMALRSALLDIYQLGISAVTVEDLL